MLLINSNLTNIFAQKIGKDQIYKLNWKYSRSLISLGFVSVKHHIVYTIIFSYNYPPETKLAILQDR